MKIFANAPSEMHCSGSSVDYIIHEKPPIFRTWNLLRLQKDKKEIRRKDKTTENSITNRQIVHRSFLILEKVHKGLSIYYVIHDGGAGVFPIYYNIT